MTRTSFLPAAEPHFALIGCAGFVAPRHLQAIKHVHGELIAATDPCDSVGVLDHYFPEARFFTEIERFDRFLDKQRRARSELRVDYVSVCSPNYLHDAHVRLALRNHAHAICEKPLVLSPWNLDALTELEREYDRRVYVVLQLRLLPQLIALKQQFENPHQGRAQVKLKYITPRGPWYHVSWKGNRARSGGLAMNIGVHFFDLLLWIFGKKEQSTLLDSSPQTMRGELVLEKADVSWELSVDRTQLSSAANEGNATAERQLSVNGAELDLSHQFTALHNEVYAQIMAGSGSGIEDIRSATELVHGLET